MGDGAEGAVDLAEFDVSDELAARAEFIGTDLRRKILVEKNLRVQKALMKFLPLMATKNAGPAARLAETMLKAHEAEARLLGLDLKARMDAQSLDDADGLLKFARETQAKLREALSRLEAKSPSEYQRARTMLATLKTA